MSSYIWPNSRRNQQVSSWQSKAHDFRFIEDMHPIRNKISRCIRRTSERFGKTVLRSQTVIRFCHQLQLRSKGTERESYFWMFQVERLFYRTICHMISEVFRVPADEIWVQIVSNLVVLNYGSLAPHLTPKVFDTFLCINIIGTSSLLSRNRKEVERICQSRQR